MDGEARTLAHELASGIAAGRVVLDPDILRSYRNDQALTLSLEEPAVLVRAGKRQDVEHVFRVANRYGTPVVPWGAGSGLSGGANAVAGCIVVSLEGLNRVVEVDEPNQVAVVQPGVLNARVKSEVADLGLWYPPDPASIAISTIGGNIATNAGGLCCVKYGVTRDWVLGLEVVLSTGRVIRTGRRTIKDVAGYDLTRLFVGSEGTLGVVTEAVLKLRSPPPSASTLVAFFPTLDAAGEAVVDLTRRASPSLLELLDAATIRAIENWKRMDLDTSAAALLIAQSDEDGDARSRHIQSMNDLCVEAGASDVLMTNDPAEGEEMLAVRRLAYPALERKGATLLDDVGVPRAKLPELLLRSQRISTEHGVALYTFGHAGDGNMHPTFVFDRSDPDEQRRVNDAFVALVRAAVELGGTVTGEHGVGKLKRELLSMQLDADTMHVHRLVKATLDPAGILNPGKGLPPAEELAGRLSEGFLEQTSGAGNSERPR